MGESLRTWRHLHAHLMEKGVEATVKRLVQDMGVIWSGLVHLFYAPSYQACHRGARLSRSVTVQASQVRFSDAILDKTLISRDGIKQYAASAIFRIALSK